MYDYDYRNIAGIDPEFDDVQLTANEQKLLEKIRKKRNESHEKREQKRVMINEQKQLDLAYDMINKILNHPYIKAFSDRILNSAEQNYSDLILRAMIAKHISDQPHVQIPMKEMAKRAKEVGKALADEMQSLSVH